MISARRAGVEQAELREGCCVWAKLRSLFAWKTNDAGSSAAWLKNFHCSKALFLHHLFLRKFPHSPCWEYGQLQVQSPLRIQLLMPFGGARALEAADSLRRPPHIQSVRFGSHRLTIFPSAIPLLWSAVPRRLPLTPIARSLAVYAAFALAFCCFCDVCKLTGNRCSTFLANRVILHCFWSLWWKILLFARWYSFLFHTISIRRIFSSY